MNIDKKRLMALALAAFMGAAAILAKDLVILHANDTHSQIDPMASGAGGVLQRKAIIDSVRKAEKNVLLVHAGDAVQGSLYFRFFRGDVEYPLMNMEGYDINILGNHEFDNGIDELAKHYKTLKSKRLSANYDFTGTPLEGLFEPYTIKKIDGKKIGFIGLNVDPESLIAAENIPGVKFNDILQTANRTAEYLKKEKHCDLVVAVTHIGYNSKSGKTSDVDLAKGSRNIDIIIGGHSHTVVDPARPDLNPNIVDNLDGKPVMIAQTGKYGPYLGYIKIDLDKLKTSDARDYEQKLIPVTDRFPKEKLDKKMMSFLSAYRHTVDSVNARVIGSALYSLDGDSRTGGYPNWIADFAADYGQHVLDSIHASDPASQLPRSLDFAIMNVGGIRSSMPQGEITEGSMLSTFPFANKMVIMEISGADILKAFEVAARKGGEAVSSEVRVAVNPDGSVRGVRIGDSPLDPDKIYAVCTIDYLAGGNDDLRSLANGKRVWTDTVDMAYPILDYIESFTANGLPIAPDPTPRFLPAIDNCNSANCL